MRIGFEEFYSNCMKEEYNECAITLHNENGPKLEKYIEGLLAMSDLSLKHTAPKYDICFGADFLVSYMEEGINYSFFLDVTFNKHKYIDYLKLTGELSNDYDTSCIDFSFGKVAFGLKHRHGGRFDYEKPVIVMVFSNIDLNSKSINISDIEVRIIESLLKSLNSMLVNKFGCNKRASKVIIPNPKRY